MNAKEKPDFVIEGEYKSSDEPAGAVKDPHQTEHIVIVEREVEKPVIVEKTVYVDRSAVYWGPADNSVFRKYCIVGLVVGVVVLAILILSMLPPTH